MSSIPSSPESADAPHLDPDYDAVEHAAEDLDRHAELHGEFATEHRTLNDTPLQKVFRAAIEHNASDLIMRAEQSPKLRLRGELKSLNTGPLDPVEFENQIKAGVSDSLWQDYHLKGSIDFAADIVAKDGTHRRFRVNVFRTRGLTGLAARLISDTIPTFEKLYLPPVCAQVSDNRQGLVLLCGITGSGKSTTIASMLDYINHRRACHILTIEDPIEFLFKDDKAIINQREIGIDVPTFPIALRAMVRENPDVVLIGEMRDKDTFEAALQAAETGHLVFGTIHASSTSQAFGRIYDLFPMEEREAIRNMLAYQMRAFIYQKLLPTLHENIARIPAVEVLLTSPTVRKFILDGREHELNDVISENKEMGMQTLTDSLVKLVQEEFVHPKIAQEYANNPEEVKMRLRGIG